MIADKAAHSRSASARRGPLAYTCSPKYTAPTRQKNMVAIVACPTCGKKVEWTETSKYRPFCSVRCKQIDLGAWADETYVIPAVTPPEDLRDEDGIAPSN